MTEKRCYIVKPSHVSSDNWEWVLKELLEPVATENGFECVLAPALGQRPHLILNRIADLIQAELVVVDVTDWNKQSPDPSVFYLLGVRHARSTGTILIAREEDDLAADVTSYHTIKYSSEGKDLRRFRRDFRRAIEKLAQDPGKPDNAVQQYLHQRSEEEAHAKVDALSKENEGLKDRIARLEEALKEFTAPPSPSPHSRIKFKRVESAE